jgi:hypothetical protein
MGGNPEASRIHSKTVAIRTSGHFDLDPSRQVIGEQPKIRTGGSTGDKFQSSLFLKPLQLGNNVFPEPVDKVFANSPKVLGPPVSQFRIHISTDLSQ